MKAKQSKLNYALCAVMAAAALTLSACSTTGSSGINSSQAFGNLNLSQAEYVDLVDNASDNERFDALILLLRSSVNSGNASLAKNTLNELYQSAQSPLQQTQAQIMEALLDSRTGQLEKSFQNLKNINSQELPLSTALYYYQLKTGVASKLFNQTKDEQYQFEAFNAEKNLLDYVNGQDKVTVINRCNQILQSLPEASLASALKNSQDYNDRGFIEYALINRSQSQSLKEATLKQYREKYAEHPICTYILPPLSPNTNPVLEGESVAKKADAVPTNVNPQSIFTLKDDAKIAVLLPLSGRFANNVGNPAKLGILTALHDRASQARVVFYDTNKMNMSEIVATINKNGTELIIGPILKPEVNALNNAGIKIPSIVLNNPEGNRPVNQWYFNLGPDYEGALAASKIYADGYRAPAVISNSNDKAAVRATNAFNASFSKVAQVKQCLYQDPALLKNLAQSCDLNAVDSVYIPAPGLDAVTIKTQIKRDLPVYLTDKSYQGLNNSSQELALSGATLGDMPWLLTDSELKASFMQSMPKANSQVQRIFASAYDAVNFAFAIDELAQDKNDVMHGLSGDLSLTDKGLIEASPMWVKLGQVRN